MGLGFHSFLSQLWVSSAESRLPQIDALVDPHSVAFEIAESAALPRKNAEALKFLREFSLGELCFLSFFPLFSAPLAVRLAQPVLLDFKRF